MTGQVVFGFVGTIGSGKGAASAYVKDKYHASVYGFSGPLRDILDRLYVPQEREHLQMISTILRQYFGQDLLAKTVAKDISRDSHPIIIVEGIRRPEDVEEIKKIRQFILVHISADIKTRYQRILHRGQNTDDGNKTFDQFVEENNREAEIKLQDVAASADEIIMNSGSINDLYKQIDALIQKYANLH